MKRELEIVKTATKLKYLLPAAAVDSTSPKEQPGCTSPPLGYISMCPIGSWIPILTPKAPRVYVCRTSTKSASSGESRLWDSVPSNMGPAGSKPVQKGQRFRDLGLNMCKKTKQFQSFVLKRKKKKPHQLYVQYSLLQTFQHIQQHEPQDCIQSCARPQAVASLLPIKYRQIQ